MIFIFQQLFRGNSVSEFEMKWRHWKDDCERRLEEGEFATNRNLETIARVIRSQHKTQGLVVKALLA